jgi:hypothetical protein
MQNEQVIQLYDHTRFITLVCIPNCAYNPCRIDAARKKKYGTYASHILLLGYPDEVCDTLFILSQAFAAGELQALVSQVSTSQRTGT